MILLDTLIRRYQDFSLSIGVYMHAHVYVCACMRVHVHVHMCVYVCACMRAHVHVYMYAYVYMYVCVHVCIYFEIHARVCVHMHSCRRILCIYTVQSLYYMRVYHRCFLTSVCVCVGGLEVGVFSACSWLALVAGGGGYVLAEVEIGVFALNIFLFLRVSGWWVCMCLYAHVHTHKLPGYSM